MSMLSLAKVPQLLRGSSRGGEVRLYLVPTHGNKIWPCSTNNMHGNQQ